nr:protein IQ-DOMAIN 14-like [Ipomoea batatas]
MASPSHSKANDTGWFPHRIYIWWWCRRAFDPHADLIPWNNSYERSSRQAAEDCSGIVGIVVGGDGLGWVRSSGFDPGSWSAVMGWVRMSRFEPEKPAAAAWTLEHSPGFHSLPSRPGSSSGSQRGGPFAPSTSTTFCGYPSYPNFMAYTESSLAKARSQSAPRQRMQLKLANVLRDTDTISEKGWSSRPSLSSKAYPGSSRLG